MKSGMLPAGRGVWPPQQESVGWGRKGSELAIAVAVVTEAGVGVDALDKVAVPIQLVDDARRDNGSRLAVLVAHGITSFRDMAPWFAFFAYMNGERRLE